MTFTYNFTSEISLTDLLALYQQTEWTRNRTPEQIQARLDGTTVRRILERRGHIEEITLNCEDHLIPFLRGLI